MPDQVQDPALTIAATVFQAEPVCIYRLNGTEILRAPESAVYKPTERLYYVPESHRHWTLHELMALAVAVLAEVLDRDEDDFATQETFQPVMEHLKRDLVKNATKQK